MYYELKSFATGTYEYIPFNPSVVSCYFHGKSMLKKADSQPNLKLQNHNHN